MHGIYIYKRAKEKQYLVLWVIIVSNWDALLTRNLNSHSEEPCYSNYRFRYDKKLLTTFTVTNMHHTLTQLGNNDDGGLRIKTKNFSESNE